MAPLTKNMQLEFPNARLLIQHLVVKDGLSGAAALAKAAHEYGLISLDAVEEITCMEGKSRCQCLAAAGKIMAKHFEMKNGQQRLAPVSVEAAYAALDREAKAYKDIDSRFQQACDRANKARECAKLAPAIFDLMLQQVRRYH